MRYLRFLLLSFVLLLLSGCKAILLHPAGMVGVEEKDLLIIAVALMLLIVIPVIVLSVVIASVYRESNHQPHKHKVKYQPDWGHNTLLEIIWWSAPIIIITLLAIITWITSHQLDPFRTLDFNFKDINVRTKKPLTIQAVALQWRWLFIYPEQHIATINFLEFPVNQPVRFLITSEGPMNGFQIPQLGTQIYAMAGMTTQLHLIANQLGNYYGESTNFSGVGFANMHFIAHVVNQQEFNNWVDHITHQSTPHKLPELTWALYQKIVQPSENSTIQIFSGVESGLFDSIIMRYMMPMSSMSSMAAQ